VQRNQILFGYSQILTAYKTDTEWLLSDTEWLKIRYLLDIIRY